MCNLSPPRLPMIYDQQSLTLHWRSFSRWGMEGIAVCFAYKSSQKFLYDLLHPIGGVISQDAWPQIVDAPLTIIFIMWLGVWVFLFCTSRRQIRRKWTMTYQCQYFTINSSISKCDHKCETRNADPEIGTDRSSQTWRNPRVDRYRFWCGPPSVCRSGFWTVLEPHWPSVPVQTQTAGGLPGPVANTRSICWCLLTILSING
jgi:hypothetical protein